MTRLAGLVNRETEEEKQEATKTTRDGEGSSEEECEEEDDLFEINLEAVKSSPPYDWPRFPAMPGSVLLANCLLPAAEISGAVPAKSKAWSDVVLFRGFLYVERD